MIDFDKLCIASNGRYNPHSSKKDWWDAKNLLSYYEELFTKTSYLPESANITERIFCYKNNIIKPVCCKVCNSQLKWDKYETRYPTYCNNKCFNKSPEGKKVRSLPREFKHSLSNEDTKVIFNKHIIERKTIAQLAKENGFSSSYIKKRFKDLNLINERYQPGRLIPQNKIEEIIHNLSLGLDPYQTSIKTGIGVNYIFKKIINVGLFNYQKKTGSNGERDLLEFVKSLITKEIVYRDRTLIKPLELDVYIPDFNLAIEYCGIYWHSLHGRDYHVNKTNLCNEKGVKLLTIFENEWINKRHVIESIIRSNLKQTNKIGARKCEIIELDNKSFDDFIEANHLSGTIPSSRRLGLTFSGELVSVMGFSKSRFTKDCEWEMTRFCNKINNTVVGAASKLFTYFVENNEPMSVVTYADKRFGSGEVYKHLGFTYSHSSKPNYWYFKNRKDGLKNRIQFQKHKLKNILKNFDPTKSEYTNMKNNGWHRIFDCGNVVYKYKNINKVSKSGIKTLRVHDTT